MSLYGAPMAAALDFTEQEIAILIATTREPAVSAFREFRTRVRDQGWDEDAALAAATSVVARLVATCACIMLGRKLQEFMGAAIKELSLQLEEAPRGGVEKPDEA